MCLPVVLWWLLLEGKGRVIDALHDTECPWMKITLTQLKLKLIVFRPVTFPALHPRMAWSQSSNVHSRRMVPNYVEEVSTLMMTLTGLSTLATHHQKTLVPRQPRTAKTTCTLRPPNQGHGVTRLCEYFFYWISLPIEKEGLAFTSSVCLWAQLERVSANIFGMIGDSLRTILYNDTAVTLVTNTLERRVTL